MDVSICRHYETSIMWGEPVKKENAVYWYGICKCGVNVCQKYKADGGIKEVQTGP